MALTIADKLKIKPGYTVMALNSPADHAAMLGKLPLGVNLDPKAKKPDQIHWFVQDKKQLEKELGKVLKLMGPGVICWVCFPKGSTGIQTDLTRDKGWEKLHDLDSKIVWITLVSFNEIWSAFGIRKNL